MDNGNTRRFRISPEAALAATRDVIYGHGKLEVLPKIAVDSLEDIATIYTPGAGFAVREIVDRPAVMFKLLVGIDSLSLCVEARDADHLVDVMCALEPNFGGYNLEDVAAPRCFEVMRRLRERLPIPVLHDDQYGTATVVSAALMNAMKVTGREAADQRVVVNGAGAAATATVDLLLTLGVGDIIVHDRDGIIDRRGGYAERHLESLAQSTNADNLSGGLIEAMRGADVFIGLSVADQVTTEMVRSMAPGPIVLALANPVPEIMPEAALAGGAAIVATGRYDYPNQCNNVLAFPGLLRGALDTQAREVDQAMCLAAARAIAAEVSEADLAPDRIVPTPLSETLYPAVAESTARAAVQSGAARRDPGPGRVAENTRRLRALVARRQSDLAAVTNYR